jgi:hypothetical protein
MLGVRNETVGLQYDPYDGVVSLSFVSHLELYGQTTIRQ